MGVGGDMKLFIGGGGVGFLDSIGVTVELSESEFSGLEEWEGTGFWFWRVRLGVGGFRGGNGGAEESSESEEYAFDEEELLDLVVTELSDFDDNSSELSDSEDEEWILRMPLDLFVFLALLPFVTGFLTLERLDFGTPKSFQPGKLTQKKKLV